LGKIPENKERQKFIWQGSQMRKMARKTKSQDSKKVSLFVPPSVIFVCTMLFVFGCKQPQSASRLGGPVPTIVDVNEPRLQALRILLEGLSDSNPMVRVNTIEVVAATRQIKLMPKVQRLSADEFVPVRFAVALAVGDLQFTLGANSAKQLLKDKDDNVKIAASYAMTKLGFSEYSQVIRAAIASEDQTIRANAALLLGRSGDKAAIKLLYWAMQHNTSEDKVVFQAAESIARLGDERIYPKLWGMLISGYADVRIMGIRAMGMLATADAKNALITMLDDEMLEVRLAAAEQLGMLNDPIGESEVLEVFEKKLTANLDKRSCERVEVLAAMAIGQIRRPSLTKFLSQMLKNESKIVRIAAAKAVLQSSAKR
jgi:HEAT repeat protein